MNCSRSSSNGGSRGIIQHKRLVIDANILIRAVLGIRVRELIERYYDAVALYIAETNAEEAEFYLATVLMPKHDITICWSTLLTKRLLGS